MTSDRSGIDPDNNSAIAARRAHSNLSALYKKYLKEAQFKMTFPEFQELEDLRIETKKAEKAAAEEAERRLAAKEASRATKKKARRAAPKAKRKLKLSRSTKKAKLKSMPNRRAAAKAKRKSVRRKAQRRGSERTRGAT